MCNGWFAACTKSTIRTPLRALKAAVDKAVRSQDADVLDCVRLVIAQMAEALRDFDAILTRKIILAKNNG